MTLDPAAICIGPVLPGLAREWAARDALGAETMAEQQHRWAAYQISDTRPDIPVYEPPPGRHAR